MNQPTIPWESKLPQPPLFRSFAITNRLLSEVLPDGAWHGKPAFVIGGGPSLRGFDWKRLKGRRTIGVNRAYEFFDPTIVFSMDTRYLHWILEGTLGQDVLDKFNRPPAYKVWLLTYTASLRSDIFVVPVYKSYDSGLREFPLTSHEGIGHGNNSGYGALNLAVALGADPIYLLGFDMQHQGAVTHFHQGYPVPQSTDSLESFKGYFFNAARACRLAGRTVINLNPASSLQWFDKRSAEEVLC